jgi:hypothetical protein
VDYYKELDDKDCFILERKIDFAATTTGDEETKQQDSQSKDVS